MLGVLMVTGVQSQGICSSHGLRLFAYTDSTGGAADILGPQTKGVLTPASIKGYLDPDPSSMQNAFQNATLTTTTNVHTKCVSPRLKRLIGHSRKKFFFLP